MKPFSSRKLGIGGARYAAHRMSRSLPRTSSVAPGGSLARLLSRVCIVCIVMQMGGSSAVRLALRIRAGEGPPLSASALHPRGECSLVPVSPGLTNRPTVALRRRVPEWSTRHFPRIRDSPPPGFRVSETGHEFLRSSCQLAAAVVVPYFRVPGDRLSLLKNLVVARLAAAARSFSTAALLVEVEAGADGTTSASRGFERKR